MDAGPRSNGPHLIEEAPVVPSWRDVDDASVVFLRPDPPVTLFLGIDTSKNTAVFRIRVPFQVDSIHSCVYALIDPGHVSGVHISPLAATRSTLEAKRSHAPPLGPDQTSPNPLVASLPGASSSTEEKKGRSVADEATVEIGVGDVGGSGCCGRRRRPRGDARTCAVCR